jgi:hypothetical protein
MGEITRQVRPGGGIVKTFQLWVGIGLLIGGLLWLRTVLARQIQRRLEYVEQRIKDIEDRCKISGVVKDYQLLLTHLYSERAWLYRFARAI